ncbi:unnamed protein product, partial [Ilex paraguariensis]
EEDPPSLALLPKPTYSAYASANAPGHSSALTIANRFTPLGRPVGPLSRPIQPTLVNPKTFSQMAQQ